MREAPQPQTSTASVLPVPDCHYLDPPSSGRTSKQLGALQNLVRFAAFQVFSAACMAARNRFPFSG